MCVDIAAVGVFCGLCRWPAPLVFFAGAKNAVKADMADMTCVESSI